MTGSPCMTAYPMICENLSVNRLGHLTLGGQDVCALAQQYGTPLYLMDADRIRNRCRLYKAAVQSAFSEQARVLFASKAASFRSIYRLMREEDMWVDTVSCGEIATAVSAGFDMSHAVFHSGNKTDYDIRYAMNAGMGYFVCDNPEEIVAVSQIAQERGSRQKILLRITPGIDPHTFAAVATGKIDSKFGFALATGQAEEAVRLALNCHGVELCGLHCHVGSQIFDGDVFRLAVEVMSRFLAGLKMKFNWDCDILDLGGGYGVRYQDSDPMIDIPAILLQTGNALRLSLKAHQLSMPRIFIEPGRSIVADAGMTVYTVGAHKEIPQYRNYLLVDGGMTDNIRYALYGAKYTFYPADKMNEEPSTLYTVAGRCCESGDLLGTDVPLPVSLRRGDLLAVATTGAYNYSMASNYNRIPRPALIMLENGSSFVAVRRETEEDLLRLDN